MELVQSRLDYLKEHQTVPKAEAASEQRVVETQKSEKEKVKSDPEPSPAVAAEPAHRDTPLKAGQDEAVGHAYPDSVEMVNTAERLTEVLALHEEQEKFTVVKLGADWCKPCQRVSCVVAAKMVNDSCLPRSPI